jgi:SAM-dependent methyltransferase
MSVTAEKTPQKNPAPLAGQEVQRFYDQVYFRDAGGYRNVPPHLHRLARRFAPWRDRKLLDVACGTGEWLMAAKLHGATTAGIDISRVATETCRRYSPDREIHCGSAERLPFSDREFDFISCLGALEHFLDPHTALREMIRVAKRNALFLLLVPNSGFLTRRLGLYSGTHQADVKEDVRSLREWRELFESAGLVVLHRWKDLHVLSRSWIFRGPWYRWPLRAGQALALPLWPLSWQYQVYHLCVTRRQ